MATQWIESRKTVVLDFNGVLDTYQGWTGVATAYPPRPGTEDFLKKLITAGFKIIILTAVNAQEVCEWLFKHHLEDYIYDVTNEKVPALVYLDDRGITFTGDFEKAFNDIINFKTHWEDINHHEGGNLWQQTECSG